MYLDKIPSSLTESGSITWTISTEDPSRPLTILQQIPVVRQIQNLPELIFTSDDRRKIYGKLMFTITSSSSSQDLSNRISFEVGRILSLNDVNIIEVLSGVSPDHVEIQHDNNLFDLVDTGLSTDEIANLQSVSRKKLEDLRLELNSTKVELITIQNNIKEYQKLLNELDSSISVVQLLDNSADILVKLSNKRDEINNNLLTSQEREKILSDKALELYDNILKVSILVR